MGTNKIKIKSYKDIQEKEAATWLIDDPVKRKEKAQRESVRYPMMAKQMGLNFLDTSWMTIADVGGGPLGGVSSVVPCKRRLIIDPLTQEYSKYFDVTHYVPIQAEEFNPSGIDLTIVTNALDHFEDPQKFIENMVKEADPGSYFAQFHAIDNALTHPHEAHEHNINPSWLHNLIDSDYETVWELKYPELRYGWVNYQGKVGQPAFCGLYRKVTGYAK